MQLLPGVQAEYERRHDEIWPELSALLGEAGIYDYSIFLDPETDALFAVLRLKPDADRDSLPGHAVMRRWWDYMADLMQVQSDNKPVEWRLKPVFYVA